MELELVILAAGRGQRFGGLKQLAPLGPDGQTLLEYALFDAVQVGIKKAVLVIHQDHDTDFQEAIVRPWSSKLEIELVHQRLDDLPVLPVDGPGPAAREKPWGTGHALWTAREKVGAKFILCNADDFYGRAAFQGIAKYLVREREKGQFAMQGYDLLATLPSDLGFSRGFCQVDEDGSLVGIQEHLDVKPADDFAPNQLVSMNFWGFGPEVFLLLEEQLVQYISLKGAEAQSEFYLPSAIQAGLDQKRCRVQVLAAGPPWLGVTSTQDVPQVQAKLARWHGEGIYPKELRA